MMLKKNWSKLLVASFCYLISLSTNAQINPQKIDIVRDKWGVAHVYAPTDAETAYGLAWAHAEDDFKTIQGTLAAGKLMAGKVFGPSGAAIDFFTQFIGASELVEAKRNTLSPDFQKLVSGYIEGINAYAAAHPKEVLHRMLFPASEDDMYTAFVLSLSAMSGVDDILGKLVNDKIADNPYESIGSNAIAISSAKTTSGESFLAINSHQPFEGPASWYEVHLNSEEGWNILGALFPGSPTIFHGVNEHLGWAHTVNHPDKIDVYKLRMDEENKLHYFINGESIPLEKMKAKLKVKMLGLNIPISKKYYVSEYGPVIENKHGFYAVAFAANRGLKAIQQWYEMTKTTNLNEFKQVLEPIDLPGFNIVYADNDHHIFYVSNAKLPVRDANFNWKAFLPGDTTATLWKSYHTFNELPQYTDPSSGYLFNMNNTPFNATALSENLKADGFPAAMGFGLKDNNRSKRFQQLMAQEKKLSYADFKRLKYDIQYPDTFYFDQDINLIFRMNPADYPEVADYLNILQQWNRRAEKESVGAGAMKILLNNAKESIETEVQAVELLQKCKELLLANYGTIEVPLSRLQVHKRGTVEMPIDGLPDVIAPMYTKPTGEKLKQRAYVGESYILLARFKKDGLPELESVAPYGTSSKAESQHYTDQIEMFVNKELKPMTLDKVKVYEEAVKVYHPE